MPNALGPLRNLRFLLWATMATLASGAIAWLGAGLQLADRSPLGLFSVGVGLAVGGAAVGTARLLHLPRTRWTTLAIVVLAVGTVIVEHGFVYRELYNRYLAAWETHRQSAPMLEVFRPGEKPKDFSTFVSERAAGNDGSGDDAIRDRWPLWLLDLALVVFGMMVVYGIGWAKPRTGTTASVPTQSDVESSRRH